MNDIYVMQLVGMVIQDLLPWPEQIHKRRHPVAQKCQWSRTPGLCSGGLADLFALADGDQTTGFDFESPFQWAFHARGCWLFFRLERRTLQLQSGHNYLLINAFAFGRRWSEISLIEKDPLEVRDGVGTIASPSTSKYERFPISTKKNLTFVKELGWLGSNTLVL